MISLLLILHFKYNYCLNNPNTVFNLIIISNNETKYSNAIKLKITK